jgi:hypothetical protein
MGRQKEAPPAKCTRCEGTVPPGTLLSPCCGVWLWTNGPPDSKGGSVFYDAKVVDVDIAQLKATHSAAIQQVTDALLALSGETNAGHTNLADAIVQLRSAHNQVTEFVAKKTRVLRLAFFGLVSWDAVNTLLVLLKVHL